MRFTQLMRRHLQDTKGKEMQKPYSLRLMDTYRNLFYTPIYAAVAGGFLYAEGLDVMFGTVPAGRPPLDMLRHGEVDIIQTGISRSLMALDDGEEDAPLHIAEINRRDGFFLISKTPADNWQWSDLEDSTIIPIGFTPVPLTSLTAVLRKHAVDIDSITMLKGMSADDALAAFRRGDADYIHMPNPQAQALIEDGAGYLAASLGSEHGYLCYSSFAATPAFIDRQPDVVHHFVRGFYNAQQWLAAADPSAIAERVKPFFTGIPDSVLQASIARYKSLDTWAETPAIGVNGYNAMRQVLIDGGVVQGCHLYERLVRPEFAERAMTE